ncbi:MAG: hypothetical protein ACXVB4_05335 [Pseudobdellovibrionaceae bacterium]
MRRLNMTLVTALLIPLLITLAYNGCSESVSKGTSTVGNPLTSVTNKLLLAVCEVIQRCHTGVDSNLCQTGVLATSGFATPLGLPGTYTTYSSILQGEENGALVGNQTQANVCQGSLETLSCSDANVIAAYDPSLANPFAGSPNMIPGSSCSQTLIPQVNLEVPIEMVDHGLASQTTTLAFSRSSTNLNTSDYDGQLTYSFEIVVANTDTTQRNVSLVNSAGDVMANIPVSPVGSPSNPQRFLTTFIPTPGANTYRVQLEGTTSTGQVALYESRIRVQQIGATKTKIYIPLMSSVAREVVSSDNENLYAYSDDSTNANYSQPNSGWYSLWQKNSSAFSQLDTNNPWTFEAILNTTSGGSASASLFNATNGLPISSSEVSTGSTTPLLVSSSFADSTPNFNNLDNMEVRIKATNGIGYIYKAGIWVKLTNLTHAEVYFRDLLAVGWNPGNVAQDIPHYRFIFDSTRFSGPLSIFHELVSSADVGASCSLSVFDNGLTDIGTSGSLVANSSLPISSSTLTRQRSASLGLVSNHQFSAFLSANPGPGNCNVVNSFVIISF